MEYYDDEEIVENRYVMSQRHEGIFESGGSGQIEYHEREYKEGFLAFRLLVMSEQFEKKGREDYLAFHRVYGKIDFYNERFENLQKSGVLDPDSYKGNVEEKTVEYYLHLRSDYNRNVMEREDCNSEDEEKLQAPQGNKEKCGYGVCEKFHQFEKGVHM